MSYFNPGKRGWSASGRELARCWGGHDQGHGTEVLGGWGRAEHPAWKRTRAVLVPCAHLKCSGSRQKVPPGLAFKSNRNSNMERGKKRGKKKKHFLMAFCCHPKPKGLRLIANMNPYLAVVVLCRMRHAGLVLVSVM